MDRNAKEEYCQQVNAVGRKEGNYQRDDTFCGARAGDLITTIKSMDEGINE
jgi:hypothetical protein